MSTPSNLAHFLEKEEIVVFSAVGIDELEAPDRSDVITFLPGAQSVIVLARSPDPGVFSLPREEKTRAMVRIATDLDRAAHRLAEELRREGFTAMTVPFLIPVREHEGRISGLVNLKHIAAAGGLGSRGKSTLLISPQYGNRLVLSGVVSSMRVPAGIHPEAADPCGSCDRCIRSCPGNAIDARGVDPFRCLNVRRHIPGPLIRPVRWLLRRRLLQQLLVPVAPFFLRFSTLRCSRCVTVCPYFTVKKTGE